MHVNPVFEDWERRNFFYQDLSLAPFSKVAEKHLKQIRKERKTKKKNNE